MLLLVPSNTTSEFVGFEIVGFPCTLMYHAGWFLDMKYYDINLVTLLKGKEGSGPLASNQFS